MILTQKYPEKFGEIVVERVDKKWKYLFEILKLMLNKSLINNSLSSNIALPAPYSRLKAFHLIRIAPKENIHIFVLAKLIYFV